MAKTWNFGFRNRRFQYQTQKTSIFQNGAFVPFELEPITGAQVDTAVNCDGRSGCLGLASLHLVYANAFGDDADIWVMIFDAGSTDDVTTDLQMPIFVQRVPFEDTMEYEAPLMSGSIYDHCFNGQPDRDQIEWEGYRFRRGVRVMVSSSGTTFTPIGDVIYITEAITYHLGESRCD